jgi:hypothetical protein
MTPEQLVQAVNKAQAEHNYDECVKLLSEIIAKQPRNTDAFNNRGFHRWGRLNPTGLERLLCFFH